MASDRQMLVRWKPGEIKLHGSEKHALAVALEFMQAKGYIEVREITGDSGDKEKETEAED